METRTASSLLAVVLLAGCSSASSDRPNDSNPSNGGAESTESTPKPPSSDPPRRTSKYVSLFAETQAGAAPSFIVFENATKSVLTFWFDQIKFFAVPSGNTKGPDAAASLDVIKDATIGEHREIDGSCVQVPFTKYDGPNALVPGATYAMRVTSEPGKFGTWLYTGVLAPAQVGSFVAVRAEVHDTSTAPEGTTTVTSTFRVEVGAPADGIEFETYEAARTQYLVGKTETRKATAMTFVDRSGARFESSAPVSLDGAPGYTAILADKAMDGATAVVELAPK